MMERLVAAWPMLLIRGGFAIFLVVCLESWRLPEGALYVGPGIMLIGMLTKTIR